MAINKVVYGDRTLMDLTEDSVTPETLMRGETAHDRSGTPIVGTMTGGGGHTIVNTNGTTMPTRVNLKFDGVDVEDDSQTDTTIVHAQIKEIPTKSEWDSMTQQEKDDPNYYFNLPWDDDSSGTGGGHIILDSDGDTVEQRPYLQFEGVEVEDDPTNEKTKIKAQIRVSPTKAHWDSLTQAQKDNPNVVWARPWANSVAFQTDRSPIGTIAQVAADYAEVDTQEFPENSGYLVCNGNVLNRADYPKLVEYFQLAYNNPDPFGGNNPASQFSLPNWTEDFTDNSIFVIKATMPSNMISFVEIDDTSTAADKVWSAQKVNSEISALNEYGEYNLTQEDSGTYIQTIHAAKVQKCGNVKIARVIVDFKAVSAGGSWKKILSIPNDDLKPKSVVSGIFISGNSHPIQMQITTGGEIDFYSTVAITAGELLSARLTYF